MQSHISDAIILRHLDYGEADRIVTFFTPDHGRRKGFARGARKSRKRFGAALESFAQVRVHWSLPRSGELLSMREVELVDLRVGLREDLVAVALAGYGCELIEEFVGDDPGHPELYYLLRSFLDHLATPGRANSQARMLFELRLLNQIGYVPHLLHCSECNSDLPDENISFDARRGGSLCPDCASSGSAMKLSRMTLGSLSRLLQTDVNRFADIRLGEQTLKEGGAAVFNAITSNLHRPLRTLSFLETLIADAARG